MDTDERRFMPGILSVLKVRAVALLTQDNPISVTKIDKSHDMNNYFNPNCAR